MKFTKPYPDEPYYVSQCGRFELWPLYLGRVRPQGYEVKDNKTGQSKNTYLGLANAKEIAAQWNNKPTKETR